MDNINDKNIPNLKMVSASQLQDADLPKLNMLVEDMLYEGLAILAGPPKSGKSWASLQLGYCISTGEQFLGKETITSECLYLALEDSYNRLQVRLKKMLNGRIAPERIFL